MRSLILAPVAALTLVAGGGQQPPVVRPAADRQREAREQVDDAIDRGLAFLARSQNASGSWTIGGGNQFGGFGLQPRGGAAMDGDIAITSLAVMAFLSAGQVPGEGKYGDAVERGIRWVLARQGRDGKLTPSNGFEMYHHGIATLMLAEAAGMTGGELAEPLRDGLERAVTVILAGQRRGNTPHAGGWRYQVNAGGGFGGDADLSVTGWQLMALRAAKNVGCDVPADRVQAAVEYVLRSVDRRPVNQGGGGFQYQPGGHVTVPCTGVGVLCLELSGKEHHLCDEAMAGGSFLLKRPLGVNEAHFFYGVYYVSQALFQLGGNYWQAYRPRLHEILLAHSGPNADGAWGGRGGDAGYGPAYCTAMAVLALTVEYRFLPIYQRFEEPLERDGRE